MPSKRDIPSPKKKLVVPPDESDDESSDNDCEVLGTSATKKPPSTKRTCALQIVTTNKRKPPASNAKTTTKRGKKARAGEEEEELPDDLVDMDFDREEDYLAYQSDKKGKEDSHKQQIKASAMQVKAVKEQNTLLSKQITSEYNSYFFYHCSTFILHLNIPPSAQTVRSCNESGDQGLGKILAVKSVYSYVYLMECKDDWIVFVEAD